MEFKSKEQLLLEDTNRKIDLMRNFLQNQLRLYSNSDSDWVQGNQTAYEVTLDLFNTFFKEDDKYDAQ